MRLFFDEKTILAQKRHNDIADKITGDEAQQEGKYVQPQVNDLFISFLLIK